MDILKPEVLSPVGSYEALEAAVRSGADAVYLGAKQFSARRNADNFDDNEFKSAVSYCRVRGVKVYLTVNIIIKDSEIEAAMSVVRNGRAYGITAVIVQDLGLARLIHEAFPDLELHASTQMTLYSPAPLKHLKQMGFSRVVAAREMSKEMLKLFCKQASALDMEVEVFVHGALCMCISGQCLLSAVIGGRSGNRGLCAGPCRLPFKVKGGTENDLSLKDLSLLSYVSELAEMGVASLKIEGRMKRPEYIAATTAAFRCAVDDKALPLELNDALNNVFTRSGFTDGYYTAKTGKQMFGIRTETDAALSKTAFSYLHSLYRTDRSSVKINITAVIRKDVPVTVTFSDGKHTVSAKGDVPQIAKSREISVAEVTQALSKLGGTPYFGDNIKADIENGLFVSASQLNELRRQAVELLNSQRSRITLIPEQKIQREEINTKMQTGQEIYARFPDSSLVPENLKDIKTVILPIEKEIPQNLKEGIRYAVEIPRWIENESYVLNQLKLFKSSGFTAAFCGTLLAVALAKTLDLEIIGAAGLNVFNSESAKVMSDLGVGEITLSAEISLYDALSLKTQSKKGIFAYGRLPLMLFKNCPLKNGRACKDCDGKGTITDRKGVSFPIICRGNHSELYNSSPLYMADKLNDIKALDFLILYFTDETKWEIEKIIGQYLSGGCPVGEFTRGLYYRNTI